MKQTIQLQEVVSHTKMSRCSSCESHEYVLPFPVTKEVDAYLGWVLGPFKLPLDRFHTIKVDNRLFHLQGRVGKNTLRVKFKQNPEQREAFEVALAAYISKVMDIEVSTNGLLQ